MSGRHSDLPACRNALVGITNKAFTSRVFGPLFKASVQEARLILGTRF